MVFISIDANEIGKKIEKFILNEQHDDLKQFSKSMADMVSNITDKIISLDGDIIMSGGDNVLAKINPTYVNEVIRFIEHINNTEVFDFSVGIGEKSAFAYMALKYAKVSGIFAVSLAGDKYIDIGNHEEYNEC